MAVAVLPMAWFGLVPASEARGATSDDLRSWRRVYVPLYAFMFMLAVVTPVLSAAGELRSQAAFMRCRIRHGPCPDRLHGDE
jgi:hypothetical protein